MCYTALLQRQKCNLHLYWLLHCQKKKLVKHEECDYPLNFAHAYADTNICCDNIPMTHLHSLSHISKQLEKIKLSGNYSNPQIKSPTSLCDIWTMLQHLLCISHHCYIPQILAELFGTQFNVANIRLYGMVKLIYQGLFW